MLKNWNYQLHSRSLSHPIPPDPMFYQREEFSDEGRLLFHVKDPLKGFGMPDRCKILKVRYIPKKSFRVVYHLSAERGSEKDVILMVRFLPRGESPKCYRKALTSALDKGLVLHLPDWDAVAWIFPEDPKLPFLHTMIDKSGVGRRLGRYLGLPLDPDQISWHLMSYLPGKQCSIRYHLPPTDHVIIGKMQTRVKALEGYCNMERLWNTPERSFRMPCPIGLDDKLGVRWESFAAGCRVEERFSEIDFDPLIQKVAHDLASLHQISMGHLVPNGLAEVLSRIERNILPRIHVIFSRKIAAYNAFYKTLLKKAESLPEGSRMTIHGDFHTANVLIDSEGLIFIDMDLLANGDPAYDLALFGSRLILLALQRRERLSEVIDAVAHLPDAYGMAGGKMIPQVTFAWYMAALLFGRQIKTCIRNWNPAIGELAPELLACANEILTRESFDVTLLDV